MAPVKVIAVGNPGAGKSSFGNCLLGKPAFHAAPSTSGGGVTSGIAESSSHKYRYIDLPGLADASPELREKAANFVTESLKENVETKILFFVRTYQGRILAEDKVLLARVAEALGSNLQNNKYGIIINQVKRSTYNQVVQKEEAKNEWLAKLWVGMTIRGAPMSQTDYVVFNPEDKDMDEETNKVKELPDHVIQFLDNFPPVKIKSEEVKKVNMASFDAAVEEQKGKDESWEDILKDIVKHGIKRVLDVAADGLRLPLKFGRF